MIIKTTPYPLRGWNSYDSFGGYINEEQAIDNIDAFIQKLAPHGYEYFVLDACWYADGDFMDTIKARKENKERFMHIDRWGRYIGSPNVFPRGLRHLADKCHDAGLKFGLHVMRGLPMRAIEENTPVKDHPSARARDIADFNNACPWCKYTMGINMDAAGAQEYYDSVVEYLANDIEVDFIKFDDAVEYPREIEAFACAIDKVARPIILSLSPGQEAAPVNWHVYSKYSNMVRITTDIWDIGRQNQSKFARWLIFENFGGPECWLDLDMIPIGGIQVHVPEGTAKEHQPVLGCRRRSDLTFEEKKVLMTQIALAASAMFYGGDLPMSNDEDMAFVTNPGMLECNANGVVGKCIFHARHIDVRRAQKKDEPAHGWLGIFDRRSPVSEERIMRLTPEELGFEGSFPEMFDVWENKPLIPEKGILTLTIKSCSCVFIRY